MFLMFVTQCPSLHAHVTLQLHPLHQCQCVFLQLEDPAIRWQMALYKDMPNRSEDSSDPEKTVDRVLNIAHVLFHLDQVQSIFYTVHM